MPILIDELDLEVTGGGEPEGDPDPLGALTPATPEEEQVLRLLALAEERRARLLTD
ncbi:hypothetical protein [uncultured Thiohalocapsa sp.]|uniref:hypothetical protein n=1 Tax=uncultured Thiohalocapsa sp. TaxID=768990 RepID=UPI0025E80C44|nr:hypothetical protein [uncultured Thiohalocapsa sp.]